MSVIPCDQNRELRRLIREYADVLKREAYKLGDHGLGKEEFYSSGLFRGAIERLRGQYSATMAEKRDFARQILDHLQANKYIRSWESAGEANRHDYLVHLNSGRIAAIELKGCLDGNNTNIFDRPPNAHEFVIWSVCTNAGADPRHNVWSGIHTRLGAEIIARGQRVDGLIVWDMVCGTIGRPCPKVKDDPSRLNEIGDFFLPPPCIYVFPATLPSPRNNPNPPAQKLSDVELLEAFHGCFKGRQSEVNYVDFGVAHAGAETVRRTRVVRNGGAQCESDYIPIRRA